MGDGSVLDGSGIYIRPQGNLRFRIKGSDDGDSLFQCVPVGRYKGARVGEFLLRLRFTGKTVKEIILTIPRSDCFEATFGRVSHHASTVSCNATQKNSPRSSASVEGHETQ